MPNSSSTPSAIRFGSPTGEASTTLQTSCPCIQARSGHCQRARAPAIRQQKPDTRPLLGGEDLLLSVGGLDLEPFWETYGVHLKSETAYPFLAAYKIGEVCTVPARRCSVSFSGSSPGADVAAFGFISTCTAPATWRRGRFQRLHAQLSELDRKTVEARSAAEAHAISIARGKRISNRRGVELLGWLAAVPLLYSASAPVPRYSQPRS